MECIDIYMTKGLWLRINVTYSSSFHYLLVGFISFFPYDFD